jgi:homocysteine S-methyltransferase
VVKQRKSVIVELDPPKHLDISPFMEGITALEKAGIDALTLADNSLATPRISNMAMATLIRERTNLLPLVHITCRDRNLIGLESHLLGLASLGIDHVLAVTGDPTKVGDLPGASSVYDLSSFGLIQMIKQMNKGLSFSGKPLKRNTTFSVAAAFNPNVHHLDKAVARLEKKIAAGADFFLSQPVFDHQQLIEIYEATKHLTKPIYIGIMPLTSSRNAEFLHHEVPGIKLTDEVRQRMAEKDHDPKLARQEGLAIAKELIDTAFDLFNGIYLITPFMRYELTVELATYVRQKEEERTLYHDRHLV